MLSRNHDAHRAVGKRQSDPPWPCRAGKFSADLEAHISDSSVIACGDPSLERLIAMTGHARVRIFGELIMSTTESTKLLVWRKGRRNE